MAVRPLMLPIIEMVRDLIGDPVTGSELLSAEQIQNKLDENRQEVRYELLLPAPQITNDVKVNPAQMVWIDYYSRNKPWETDEIVQDAFWTQLVPVSFEPLVGHWQFSYLPTPGVLPPKSVSPGQVPPVWVTGKVYDINAAAYKCCRLLIAQLARTTYNFNANGQALNRQGIIQNLKEVMAECARNIRPRTIPLVRSDAAIQPAAELLRIGGQYGTSSW